MVEKATRRAKAAPATAPKNSTASSKSATAPSKSATAFSKITPSSKSVSGVAKPAAIAKADAPKAATRSRGQVLEPVHDVKLGFLSDFVGFHLRLAQDASYRAFSRQSDKDLLKPGRFPALAIIHLNPGISQSALGRAIARDKSTVSPLIKDLQTNGFISRKPSAHDGRSVTLALTKKGERTLDRLRARAAEHEAELDAIIGASKSRLMAMLGKIISGMA